MLIRKQMNTFTVKVHPVQKIDAVGRLEVPLQGFRSVNNPFLKKQLSQTNLWEGGRKHHDKLRH